MFVSHPINGNDFPVINFEIIQKTLVANEKMCSFIDVLSRTGASL